MSKDFFLNELFQINGIGIVSIRDAMAYKDSKAKIKAIVDDVHFLSLEEIKAKYNDVNWGRRDEKVEFVKQNVLECGVSEKFFVQCQYRPFDRKWTYYTGKSKGLIERPVKHIMQHFLTGNNFGLVVGRPGQAVGATPWNLCLITKDITDFNLYCLGSAMVFPLYLYSENNRQQIIPQSTERYPNLNTEIVMRIADKLRLTFTNEKDFRQAQGDSLTAFAPIDILDYIYAVLHSPAYRENYKELLKIDFPRVPYPKDRETFWQLVKLGGLIREIHLLESPTVENYITEYPNDGDNKVTEVNFVSYIYVYELPDENGNFNYPDYLGSVHINEHQYFADVPMSAWEFYIGGYQPAQKWLEDRKGRKLEFADILHYQKIIAALTETSRLMKEIDKIDIE